MPYSKTTWTDRSVERPMTFILQDNGDGTHTLIPAEGTVLQAGTPITATNLNKMENGISLVDTKVDKAGGEIAGNVQIHNKTAGVPTEFEVKKSLNDSLFLVRTLADGINLYSLNYAGGTPKKLYLYGSGIYFDATAYSSVTEEGFCGIGGMPSTVTTGAISGVGVNFRLKKTYTPSSITLTGLSSNVTPKTTQITRDGFWLYIEGNGATTFLYLYWRGTYQA